MARCLFIDRRLEEGMIIQNIKNILKTTYEQIYNYTVPGLMHSIQNTTWACSLNGYKRI